MFSAWITALIAGVSTLVIQKLFFPYFWIDLKYLTKVISYGIKIEIYKKTAKVVTVLDRFMQQAQKIPNKPFIIYEDNAFTYQDVDKRSNQVAQVFFKQGVLKKGDTVALLMSNEPDFINVWFGLCKLGCAVAFLNFNIKSRSLLHCFNSCGAKTLVVGSDMTDTLEDILPNLHEDNISVWIMASESHQPGINTILDKLEDAPDEPVPAHLRATDSVKTPTLYIFTSGTTGATFVLKKKFSASQFWSDCRKYNVTVFQYIGEICRYLCNMPKKEGEKDHKVRMGVGNGVQQNIWKEFLDRFGDIKLCELYGSTEGNVCFMNHVGKIGAVGRSNFFYKRISKYCLVKYDLENGEIILNEQGFCEEVKKGEAGLLLSQINSISPFFGYAGSKSLTEKKLLRDVFKKGDVYLNTGDLMVEDHEDFIYFNDRIGDTFRWKGENVSTTEVADVVGIIDFLQEANIYGVSVPGYEGKAGMAAVVLNPGCGFDGKSLYEHVENYLPGYARPRFVRIQKSMEITGTFKQQKFRLVESGFNPSTITDSLYFLDESQKCYVPLTTEIFDIIASGQIKL
ncbi:long-chain fatty acid transport protein 6-like isoform X2 [Acipenser ruthenus]|uniref:long-chain fatty acid transport protein 6 isoform X2 n=1 Tax=Acipenser ruthenus TaxID=7906 RepID=UPI00145B9349|nr:long-chain fatty acid transport protein 6 isoform X2 [Acipenser ruthenus]XP_058878284.1 long-chain fatty acid transport protein 6-like isoform X2 [Acipenser ruthenus]